MYNFFAVYFFNTCIITNLIPEREKLLHNPSLQPNCSGIGSLLTTPEQHDSCSPSANGIPVAAAHGRTLGGPIVEEAAERASTSPTVGRWGCEWPS